MPAIRRLRLSSLHRPLVVLALAGAAAAATGAPGARQVQSTDATGPAGINCNLAAPPRAAGEDRHMGARLAVYPRNPDIGPAYAGCQTLWVRDGDEWLTVTVAHYEAGRVVRIESPLVERDPIEACLLKDGAVVRGDPRLCADLDLMRFESLPAGCLADAASSSAATAAPGPRCARR